MTRPTRRLVVIGCALAWAAVAAVGSDDPQPPRRLPDLAPADGWKGHADAGSGRWRGELIARGRMVGNASCAAQACHGGDVPQAAAGGELLTFGNHDPHRNCYPVLLTERSRRMVELLAKGNGTEVVPAHRNAVCLGCHGAAPPNLADAVPASALVHREGGGCESCHGAAENWLTLHYTAPWKGMSDADKAKFGLTPTKDLAYRAQMCAGCHVGEPGREVDHQLIAAGHPALRFEHAAYHARPLYTRHWQERTYGPDVEAWAWLIGQVGTARAAADLLRHRAAEAESPHPTGGRKRDWPELAEYACFSCHQDVTNFTNRAAADGYLWPGPARTDAPKKGAAPWGTWLYPVSLALADRKGSPGWTAPPSRTDGLAKLAGLFRDNERPAAADAQKCAADAVADLDRWLLDLQTAASRRSRSQPLQPAELRAALAAAVKFAGDVPTTGSAGGDWDRYTQGFLASAALYRTLTAADASARSPQVEADLKAIAEQLRFPKHQDSPAAGAKRATEIDRRWKAVADTLAAADRRAGR